MKDIATLATFKDHLDKRYTNTDLYKPYLSGKTSGHVYLARIRMKLSGLNFHRKKYHFINHSVCPNCNSPIENEEHFFLHCANYAAERMEMMEQLRILLPHYDNNFWNLTTKKNRSEILNIIINGCRIIDLDENIFNITSKYVQDTERFEQR